MSSRRPEGLSWGMTEMASRSRPLRQEALLLFILAAILRERCTRAMQVLDLLDHVLTCPLVTVGRTRILYANGLYNPSCAELDPHQSCVVGRPSQPASLLPPEVSGSHLSITEPSKHHDQLRSRALILMTKRAFFPVLCREGPTRLLKSLEMMTRGQTRISLVTRHQRVSARFHFAGTFGRRSRSKSRDPTAQQAIGVGLADPSRVSSHS